MTPEKSNVSALLVRGDTVLVSTVGNGLFRSTDSWPNWTLIGFEEKGIDSFAIVGSDLFFAITNCAVFWSSDEGQSWTEFNQGLTTVKMRSITTSSRYCEDSLIASPPCLGADHKKQQSRTPLLSSSARLAYIFLASFHRLVSSSVAIN